MSLGVGAAFTSSQAWASKCNLILMVLAMWTIHTEGVGEDNGEVPFAAASLGSEVRWGPHSLSSRGRSQSWKPGKHRLKGHTKTAHQQANNTTDDRPRGRPRATGPRVRLHRLCQAAAAAMEEDHPDLSTALLQGPKSPCASETAFWYSESSFKECKGSTLEHMQRREASLLLLRHEHCLGGHHDSPWCTVQSYVSVV